VSRGGKLLGRAKRAPRNFPFKDLQTLLAQAGFCLVRRRGSHHYYKHAALPRRLLNYQKVGKDAKPSQVDEAVELIEEHGLLEAD
jgi:predicted RNA binding protein YcfA (HicA-like mRNA interferase family)